MQAVSAEFSGYAEKFYFLTRNELVDSQSV